MTGIHIQVEEFASGALGKEPAFPNWGGVLLLVALGLGSSAVGCGTQQRAAERAAVAALEQHEVNRGGDLRFTDVRGERSELGNFWLVSLKIVRPDGGTNLGRVQLTQDSAGWKVEDIYIEGKCGEESPEETLADGE